MNVPMRVSYTHAYFHRTHTCTAHKRVLLTCVHRLHACISYIYVHRSFWHLRHVLRRCSLPIIFFLFWRCLLRSAHLNTPYICYRLLFPTPTENQERAYIAASHRSVSSFAFVELTAKLISILLRNGQSTWYVGKKKKKKNLEALIFYNSLVRLPFPHTLHIFFTH